MESSFPKSVSNFFSVGELVSRIGNAEILNAKSDSIICSVSSPGHAKKGTIVFLKSKGPNLFEEIRKSNASVFVVSEKPILLNEEEKCFIFTEDPLGWFILALRELIPDEEKEPTSNDVMLHKTAVVEKNVSIGYGSVIQENTWIGAGTRIGCNTVVGQNTRIGRNCFIQDNVTIGAIGLGYHFNAEKERMLLPHLGSVLIGDRVVIGSGSVIIRGQLTDTILEKDVRLGNLVNIGHNVLVRRNTVISSNCSLAGGADIGSDCNIAMGVLINSKVIVEKNVTIGLGSVVTKSLRSGKKYFGNPARPLPTIKSF